ncbi:MAG: ribosome maturation factor RimP [Blastocatellia bacterium]|nr:ribosome maturation factor RimP [Blastocatellia bacterium]
MNDQVIALIEKIITSEGYELVHCELGTSDKQKVLRVLVDHPKGVTLDGCSFLSQQLSVHLDQADLIPFAYTLEVSSPGVERGLYRLRDYHRFLGHKVKLKTRVAIESQRNFRGTLAAVRETIEASGDPAEPLVVVTIKGTRKEGPTELEIPFSWIEKASLEVELKDLFRVAQEKAKEQDKD